MANNIPNIALLLISSLQITKYIVIPKDANKNLFDITINFIFIKTNTHIISDIIYPTNVAIDAPSIPNIGISKKFKIIFTIAPNNNIIIFGHVFFTTKNFLIWRYFYDPPT